MPTMSLWTLGSVGWLVDWLAGARAQFVDWCVFALVGLLADLQAQIVDCLFVLVAPGSALLVIQCPGVPACSPNS